MNIRRKSKRPEPHIPFISLADIAWQIIIFFLLAAVFASPNALKLDVPTASAKQPNAQAPPKMITVQATEAQVLLDGKPVPVEMLQSTIANLLKNKTTEQEKAVIIEGKDDLSFQRDAEIMYAIQQAGGILVMQEEK